MTPARTTRVIGAAALNLLWIALGAFHLVLLVRRIADASILEPAVLGRWLGSVALLAGVWFARRYAIEGLRSRKAQLVFWLLVVLLHAAVPADQTLATEHVAVLLVHGGIAVVSTFLLLASASGSSSPLRMMRMATAPRSRSRRWLICGPAAPRSPPLV